MTGRTGAKDDAGGSGGEGGTYDGDRNEGENWGSAGAVAAGWVAASSADRAGDEEGR
jgi:hypothetical protein